MRHFGNGVPTQALYINMQKQKDFSQLRNKNLIFSLFQRFSARFCIHRSAYLSFLAFSAFLLFSFLLRHLIIIVEGFCFLVSQPHVSHFGLSEKSIYLCLFASLRCIIGLRSIHACGSLAPFLLQRHARELSTFPHAFLYSTLHLYIFFI